MADRDNGKVEHPLTLGPKRWEEGAVCAFVCLRGWDWGGGCRVEGRRGLLGKRFTPWSLVARTHIRTHIITFL